MTIQCAWCGKLIGKKKPYDWKVITHSMCFWCKLKQEYKLFKRKMKWN
jgi:hypothetical protein